MSNCLDVNKTDIPQEPSYEISNNDYWRPIEYHCIDVWICFCYVDFGLPRDINKRWKVEESVITSTYYKWQNKLLKLTDVFEQT